MNARFEETAALAGLPLDTPRESLTDWLTRNDKDGVFTDEARRVEFPGVEDPCLTLQDCWLHVEYVCTGEEPPEWR